MTVYLVRIKRVQYGDAYVRADSEEEAKSWALDSIVAMVLPPFDAVDIVDDITEVEED